MMTAKKLLIGITALPVFIFAVMAVTIGGLGVCIYKLGEHIYETSKDI